MFYALPNKENKTLKIVPEYLLRLTLPFSKERETLTLTEIILESMFNGKLMIPLEKVSLEKLPIEVKISNGRQQFNTLDEAVEEIYSTRSYSTAANIAKKNIRKRLIKAIVTKTSLYGTGWSLLYSYTNALDYEVLL